MTDAAPPSESSSAAKAPLPHRPWASRSALIGVGAALAAALAIGWWDTRHTASQLRTEVARELALAQAASAQATAKEAALAGELREAQAKLALLETRLAESQSQQASLESLYRDLSPSRDELALNEVEQVLALAGQELALAGNVQAALAALQLADTKLARLDRPRLAPLRRALAADMDRLKAVPFVDVTGIAARLDQALAGIDTLPLARDERLPPAAPIVDPAGKPPAAWERFLRDVWADFKGLVRIEVSDRPAAPLVLPQQQYFLRENLRLRLISARIALLARNEASYRADLKAADAWVKQYFDTRTKPVQALSATLGQLAAVTMPGEIPDLAQSQAAVRALRAAQERTAQRPPDKPAGAVAR
jgi:uroporphyrin-3 C-methyltransferase